MLDTTINRAKLRKQRKIVIEFRNSVCPETTANHMANSMLDDLYLVEDLLKAVSENSLDVFLKDWINSMNSFIEAAS